jgi:hypothetical protein
MNLSILNSAVHRQPGSLHLCVPIQNLLLLYLLRLAGINRATNRAWYATLQESG